MQQIGFVGLGAMGSVMAPLPARAGFSVIGFDTAPKRIGFQTLLMPPR